MASLVWFITGCSTGLGLEFVHSALRRGDKVIATARNPSKLAGLKNAGAHVMALDITAEQKILDAVAKEAIAVYGGIDVLVNNGAYCVYGTLEDTKSEQWEAQFKTNVFGTINITRSFLPHFRSRKTGTVVWIGSIAGWDANAAVGPYCSSKFALEGIVESFQRETAHLNIKSITIEPGYFRTNLLSAGNVNPVTTTIPDYKDLVETVSNNFKAYDMKQPGDPRKAAEIVVDVVRQEGRTAGKGIPERLPLGKDALGLMREKCKRTLKLLEEWEEIISSTDFPEGS